MQFRQTRRGAIVPLSAFLMVFLLGMVAFVVDVGWITVVQSDLQNAADAAALAGANTMMDYHVEYHRPGVVNLQKSSILAAAQATARAKAKEYAQYNAAGGVNSLNLLDSDIEFGFTDAAGMYTASPTYSGFPNTIKVTLRRDSTANGTLGLFFGKVLGVNSTSLAASAAATLYTGSINSFTISKHNTGMLPITYDLNDWNLYLKTGLSADMVVDGSGKMALDIYSGTSVKGNFGQLSLRDDHVGASTAKSWVTDGVSSSDIQVLRDHSLIPLSNHPDQWDWNGNPGFDASLVMTMNHEVGSAFLLPLYKPKSTIPYRPGVGEGSHYDYNIVAFVAVRILPANEFGKKSDRDLVVEPAALIEPNAIFDASTIVPAGTTSTLVTTFVAPRLTQ